MAARLASFALPGHRMQNAHAAQARITAVAELLQNAGHDTVYFVGGRSGRELELIGEAAGDLLLSVHEYILASAASTERASRPPQCS